MSTDQLSNMQSHSSTVNPLKNAHSGLQIPQTTSQIRYPTRPQNLDSANNCRFQLSEETWDHLGNQKNEMAETNRLIKRAVKNT